MQKHNFSRFFLASSKYSPYLADDIDSKQK